MQENSLRYKELVEIIGSKSKVSGVLNKKRSTEKNANRTFSTTDQNIKFTY